MEINWGGQWSQDKNGRARCSYAPGTFMWKNISAHAQSVGINSMLARTSMVTASDYVSRMPTIYLSCLSLIFRHWVTNRLSWMLCAREIIESCLIRCTEKSKAILKLAGIFIPTSEYMKHHIFELRRKIWRYDWSSQLYTQLRST